MKLDGSSAHREGNEALASKKVLIIVENLPVPFDRRVWQEAIALRSAGANVCVICPVANGYEKRHEVLEGISIYRHPLPLEGKKLAGYVWEYLAALFWQSILAWKVFIAQGFDVIHACNPPDLIFLIALQFKPFGKRFIFDHHDLCPELYEAKFGRRGLQWRILRIFEKLTFKTADVVIATNESYQRIALTRGGKCPKDVFIVRSGPDLARIRGFDPDERWKNGRKFLVGYVGVMGRQEGIDLLLEAAYHLIYRRDRRDIQFALAGSGPSFEGMNTLCRRMGLAEYVTFLGRVPDETLFSVLSTADICVNPDPLNDLNDKSTMNKILEYMALGKPIVQFDLAEGKRSADEASLYAKPNDPRDFAEKIEMLLADEEARSRMGVIGIRRIQERLAWHYQIPHLLAAYKRAIGEAT